MALYEHRAFQKRQMTLGLLVLGDAPVPTLLERACLAEETGCDADGRAILGIGAGISGFAELGINRRKPARAIRELVSRGKPTLTPALNPGISAGLQIRVRGGVPIAAKRGPTVR